MEDTSLPNPDSDTVVAALRLAEALFTGAPEARVRLLDAKLEQLLSVLSPVYGTGVEILGCDLPASGP